MRSVWVDGITDAVAALVRVLLLAAFGLLLDAFFHCIKLAVEHLCFLAACSSVMPFFKSASAACLSASVKRFAM
jgi:hypothetical protein